MNQSDIDAISAEYSRIVPGFKFIPNPRDETPWLTFALDKIVAAKKSRPVGRELGMFAWEVEKGLILSKSWKEKYGWNEPMHMIRLACLLFPSLAPDPWFQVKFWAIWYTQQNRKKFCNYFGCASSGKSQQTAIFALLKLAINRHNKVLITGPWEKTRDETIWKQALVGGANELISRWGRHVEGHWDISIRDSEGDISFGGKGNISCRASDKHGKLQGGKQERSMDAWNPMNRSALMNEAGSLTLILEEAAKWPNTSILRDFNNLVSNPSFLCISNCNPENTVSGLDAELGAPLGREFSTLNPEEDYHWETRRSGFVFRFDGLRSPRILGWESLCHPQLFGPETAENIADTSGGKESDGFWAQVRAFPRGTIGGRLVTDETRQIAAGVFQRFIWSPTSKTYVLYLDAAFGGNDPATYCLLCCGDRRDAAGTIINTAEGMEIGILPINSNMIANSDHIAELKKLGWIDPELTEGKPIIPGLQCAWQLRKKIEAWKAMGIEIHPRFTGCDQSMRGDQLSLPMRALVGSEIAMIDPTERPSHDKPVLPIRKSAQPRAAGQPTTMYWTEFCTKKVTEIWLVAAWLIHSGAVRGGEKIVSGLKAMGTRYIKKSQSRTDVMSKEDWKETAKTWFDAGDALAGALFLAYSRGLVKYEHTPEAMQKSQSQERTISLTPQLMRAAEWRAKRENAALLH